ncbi:hypothetical protein BDC45DRAFT_533012 [Circinella umbellata]|nr:hypothetical protein BDC45DRAFT_533012 [Circinella umbellata]
MYFQAWESKDAIAVRFNVSRRAVCRVLAKWNEIGQAFHLLESPLCINGYTPHEEIRIRLSHLLIIRGLWSFLSVPCNQLKYYSNYDARKEKEYKRAVYLLQLLLTFLLNLLNLQILCHILRAQDYYTMQMLICIKTRWKWTISIPLYPMNVVELPVVYSHFCQWPR